MAKRRVLPKEPPKGIYYKIHHSGGRRQQMLLRRVKPGEHFDFVMPEEKPFFYLVEVEYTTGDSFGVEPGNLCQVWLAETPEEAWHVAKAIREDYEKKEDPVKWKDYQKWATLKTEFNGKQITFYTGTWKGYFETLDGVEVIMIGVMM